MSDKSSGWDWFLIRAEILEVTMIAGETHEQYEALLRELYDEFTPRGTMEEHQVFRLAKLLWSRKRIEHYGQLKLAEKQFKINLKNHYRMDAEQTKLAVAKISNPETRKEFEGLLANVEPPLAQRIIGAWLPLESSDPEEWQRAMEHGLALLDPKKPIELHRDYFELIEQSSINENLTMLERMDASIDRTLKRLMQLKTMKQMFRQLEPKQVGSDKKATDKKDRKATGKGRL